MKILIFGLNWIGDVVMSFPAISHAIENGNEVHILTRPHLAELYQLIPGISKIWSLPTKGAFWQLLNGLKDIRKERFDRVVLLPNSLRTASIARFCGTKNTFGFHGDGRRFLLGNPIPKPVNFKSFHESNLYIYLMNCALELKTKLDFSQMPILPEPTFKIEKQIKLLKTYNLTNKKYFLIAPGAAFGSAKRWPPDYYAKLGKLLTDQLDLRPVIVGGPDDKQMATEIVEKTDSRFLNLAGKTSLTELFLLAEQANFMVANDSGTMHISAFAQTPVAVPVGPTDMIRTGPMMKKVALVTGDECPIAPCRQKVCSREDHICMNSITPELMAKTIKDKLLK
jgi:heptosyltransferase-2